MTKRIVAVSFAGVFTILDSGILPAGDHFFLGSIARFALK
jgi:hypothetical protein